MWSYKNLCEVAKFLDSKACKAPMNFLPVKLLWHIQILGNTETPGEKLFGGYKSNVVMVMWSLGLVVVKQNSEHSQRFHFNSSEVKQRSERSQWS